MIQTSPGVTDRYLSVDKRLEHGEGTPVVVTFSISAESRVPVAFRLVDELPDGAAPDDVGAHPAYDADHWRVDEEGHVTFSDRIAPGETITAFYYLDTEAGEDLASTPPRIVESQPYDPESVSVSDPPTWRDGATDAETPTVMEGPVPVQVEGGPTADAGTGSPKRDGGEQSDATAKEVVTSRIHGAFGRDEDSSATFANLQTEYDRAEYDEIRDDVDDHFADDVTFEELVGEAADPADSAEPPAGSASQDDGAAGATGSGDVTATPTTDGTDQHALADPSSDEAGVLPQLLGELEERDLSAAERSQLRDALGLGSAQHTTVRLRHLQSQVADLTAYVDALETFLDENGTAKEVLDSLQADIEAVEARLDDLESAVTTTANRQAAHDDRLDAIEGTTERVERDLEARLESLEETVERHDDDIASLTGVVGRLDAAYDTIVSSFRSAARDAPRAPESNADE